MGFLSLQSIIPPGTIFSFAGTTAPDGYLLCDGTAVSRTTYAALATALYDSGNAKYAYGSGDGSTTFNLPDFRGRFLRGVDGSAGRDPDKASRTAMNTGGNTGNAVGSIQAHANQDHNHRNGIADDVTGEWVYGGTTQDMPGSAVSSINNENTSRTWQGYTSYMNNGNTSSEARPVNAYINYIIKI